MALKVEGVVDGGMRAEHALNDARQRRRGPVKPPLKRARRISITIGSACAARSIEVSGNDRYGASCSLRPSLEGLLAEPTAGAQLWW